jgi:hypothetical protein
MTLEHSILEAVRSLPVDKQQELLDYAERLKIENQSKKPFQSIKGLWADLDISLSEDHIDEVRREMWKDFPRDEF